MRALGDADETVREFLGMRDAEALIVELRIQLVAELRRRRIASGLTQAERANAIGSSQSRIAKMESGDPQASSESLLRAVIAVGGKPRLRVA